MSGRPLDFDDPQQPYQQVAANIRAQITSGDIAVGDQLSSVRELAKEYGVSGGTIQQALRLLRQEGLIVTWQGRGTFVRRRQADTASAGDAEVPTIMRRLDEILDRIEQLEEQVAAVEKDLKKTRTPKR
ncbi:GntR family transcriptional regulator [Actinopolymorpha pittospori]|uniref:DNA-binding GntR family transcriptional regulator n=1 Tax=Actinopolymorpha pittospori TaxID=648752 RepID=A0A927RHR8_9ACTN|nr:DNA-binding GntR family transcriptional regulator [Actinopolymorpha pittospori]